MPVNQFGKRVFDKDAEEVEMRIVPAWIDYTEDSLGQCLFLECGDMESADSWSEETDENGNTSGGFNPGGGGGHFGRAPRRASRFGQKDDDDVDYNSGALAQTDAGKAIAKGEQDKSDAYFDQIFVGFWDGQNRQTGKLPCPTVDSIEITDDFMAVQSPYSLRINKNADAGGQYVYPIDARKKYNFSFLSEDIPDPRAVFYIDGGKYVCEKITATFHEGTGKSLLQKGVFYKII